MRQIELHFLLLHGVGMVDDWRIINAMIFAIRNDLRWRIAPSDDGPHKRGYNWFNRWCCLGVCNKIFANIIFSSN
jgi:transposase